jgi:pilus assembly protein Flp/PilA
MLKWIICKLRRDEEGATAIEYGLLAALIAVAIVVVVFSLGRGLGETFDDVDQAVRSAPATQVAPTSGATLP